MKKISILSALLFVSIIIFSAYAFKQQSPNPNTGYWIDVLGCDDCKNIVYCVNGSPEYISRTKHFYVECDPNSLQQNICVRCCGDRYGTATIMCGTTNVKITVSPDNAPCYCGDKNKTK
ncbi:MAG: hypothetical protein PHN88_10285 [Ignavibacteria bacterium]|nr:hypothetical protein [Ignavibacteria bacterium]